LKTLQNQIQQGQGVARRDRVSRRLVNVAFLATWVVAEMMLGLATAQPVQQDAPRKSPLAKAPNGQMAAPDIARILNRGELVVAIISSDSAPFFSEKDGSVVGTDVDVARLIAKELGVPVRFDRSAKTFEAVVEMAAEGRADIGMGRLARTVLRAQKVSFSTPYMKLPHSLMINRLQFSKLSGDRAAPSVIRNFSGTLGVIGRSAWEEFGRRNFPKAKIVTYPSWDKVVEAVTKGDVVAAYRDEFEIQKIMRADPRLALTLRTVTFNDIESSLSLMIGIQDTTLLSFVNEVITMRTEKPTVAMLLKELKQ
jgi:ABC-type amino acid transport substrate-binding protein